MAADTAYGRSLVFPPLNVRQERDLRAALGPMVALANPLDYHTYIWRDVPAMTRAFSAMIDPDLALTMLVVDFPRGDCCDPDDWDCAVEAIIAAQAATGGPFAMVSTLPELMPEEVAGRLMKAGVLPLSGLREAMVACEAASLILPEEVPPLFLPGPEPAARLLAEADAKARLLAFGLQVPKAARCMGPEEAARAAEKIGFPVVLKGEGVAHKTEAGAVMLNLRSRDAVVTAAETIPAQTFLVEQQITDVVAEILVGVVRDPAHGYVLTLAAGGTLTELLQDSASLLLPASDAMVEDALNSLRIAPLLDGYRGGAAANRAAILAAVRAVQAYVLAEADGLEEIEINPLLCTPEGATAADALIRREEPHD